MKEAFVLPKDAITLDNRYGKMYPKNENYYGFIVGERPAMHIWQDKVYTIDVYQEKRFIDTIVCKHGEW